MNLRTVFCICISSIVFFWLSLMLYMFSTSSDLYRFVSQFHIFDGRIKIKLTNITVIDKKFPESLYTVQDILKYPNKLNTDQFQFAYERKNTNANGPGENGTPVVIEKNLLSHEDVKKYVFGYNLTGFNVFVSDRISVHRSLPDIRHEECKKIKFHSNLPSTSIIICFQDEPDSVLKRTVHSVLNNSPTHLVKEILLVDDFSSLSHLKKPLEDYMKKLEKVRIVRTPRREGLVRARLFGVSFATGEALTFLDSHVECTIGWLEPLLSRIASNWTNVVFPVVKWIDKDTFEFKFEITEKIRKCGFNWYLFFNFRELSAKDMKSIQNKMDPYSSPTMPGGIFTINKRYFEYLGGYDPGLEIWGSENLELSFKIWMCGGHLDVSPCSNVGHVFRAKKFVGDTTFLTKNAFRLANVWLDDYKKYVYYSYGNSSVDYGDISERKVLRDKLKCKSFDWYLTNIFPEMFKPWKSLANGEIRSAVSAYCIDRSDPDLPGNVIMFPCNGGRNTQLWLLTHSGQISISLYFRYCLNAVSTEDVSTSYCHSDKQNQSWIYRKDNSIYNVSFKRCLEWKKNIKYLTLSLCTENNSQQWLWKRGPF